MWVVFIFINFGAFVLKVQCFNVLAIFPHPGKSHFDVFQPLFVEMSSRGHNVTVISQFPINNRSIYLDINISGMAPVLGNSIDMTMLANQTRIFKYLGMIPLAQFADESCATLGSKQVQDFIKSRPNFDIAIVEMFTTDCYLSVPHVLNIPFIGASSSVIMPSINERFGNMDNPAYIPMIMLDYSDKMNFIERLDNTFGLILYKLIHYFYFYLPGMQAVQKHISDTILDLEEIAKHASLLLVNSHFSLSRPRPLAPNVIEVGGIHLKSTASLSEVCKLTDLFRLK